MNRRFALLRLFACLLAIAISNAARAADGPHVDIVVGADPPAIVRLAAEELAGQMQRLFQAETAISAQVPGKSNACILLGSPDTNAAIRAEDWPKVSDQGIVLRSIKLEDRPVLIVGGGSEPATLWAVYELGHRWGIRYLLSGDIDPPRPPELDLSKPDITLEPTFRVRTWVVQDDSAIGACAWPAADYHRLIDQLAKLKFNRLRIMLDGHLPFVTESASEPLRLFDGAQFPITTDTAGRKAFKGAKEFTNLDFDGKTTPADVHAAAQAYVRALTRHAESLGMTVSTAPAPSAGNDEECRLLLSSDEVGMLPQIHLARVHSQLVAARTSGQKTWSAWCRTPGETDPCLHYLSQASFDKAVTADSAMQDLYGAMGGREDFVGRMQLCWALMEQANDKTEQVLPNAAAPRMGALLARYRSASAPAVEIKPILDLYTRSTNELYRGLNSSERGAHTLVYYQSKRGEFAINYLTGIDALEAAALARRNDDKEAQCEQLEKAVEAFYNAFDALATVARDPSDRAVIAVGNKYIYQPLVEELDHVTAQ